MVIRSTLALMMLLGLTACQPTNTSQSTPSDTVEVRTSTIQTIEAESAETFGAIYTDYQAGEEIAEKHIIFFFADWCPTCVKWEGEVKNRMEDLATNAIILKANYDTETELKTQYEITQQSTAVFINADGSVAKKEADPSVESINAFFAN